MSEGSKKKEEMTPIVAALDTIIDATSKYLRAIFPPLFKISKMSEEESK